MFTDYIGLIDTETV